MAHLLLEIEAARPVAVPEALGDVRIAVQVDPGSPQAGLLDERAQDHVAAVRAAVDGQPAVRPGLLLDPAGGIDEVEHVGVAPLVVVGPAEVPAIAGRAAEVDVEERVALLGEQQAERREAPVRLPGRAAVRDRRWSGTRRPPRLPVAVGGRHSVPSTRSPSRAVRATRSPAGTRPSARARGQHRRPRIGDLARPRALGGDARDGQQPQVLRAGLALADRRQPGAVGQPADRTPDAVPGRDPDGRPDRAGDVTVRGVLGGRPRPRLGGPPRRASGRAGR